jgi:hypothetical protein
MEPEGMTPTHTCVDYPTLFCRSCHAFTSDVVVVTPTIMYELPTSTSEERGASKEGNPPVGGLGRV